MTVANEPTVADKVKPVAGPLFRQAASFPVDDPKQRKLLCLIAAYADAGEPSPTVRTLAKTTGSNIRTVDALLKALHRDRWLRVKWRASDHPHPRNVYELCFSAQTQEEAEG